MFAAAAATAMIAAASMVTTPDPGGGADWTARAVKASGQRDCAVLAQGAVRKGRYCARLGAKQPFQYSVRYETPPDATDQWRSVFVVTFTSRVQRATLETPDGTVAYRKGSGPRLLLAVVTGRVEQGALRTTVRVASRTYTASAGRARTAEVADPLGDTGWRTAADNEAGAKRVCVSWERTPPRFSKTEPANAFGEERCGAATSTAPVRAVETVDGRLVAYGLVLPRITGVALRAGDRPLDVAFDRGSRSYLAVLPAGDDPASLVLRLTSASGSSELPASGG